MLCAPLITGALPHQARRSSLFLQPPRLTREHTPMSRIRRHVILHPLHRTKRMQHCIVQYGLSLNWQLGSTTDARIEIVDLGLVRMRIVPLREIHRERIAGRPRGQG